jgi:hypothetical protein
MRVSGSVRDRIILGLGLVRVSGDFLSISPANAMMLSSTHTAFLEISVRVKVRIRATLRIRVRIGSGVNVE